MVNNKNLAKRVLAFLVVAVMMLPMLPATALSGDVSNIDGDPAAPAHDISVMSFNVLDYDTSEVGYAAPSERAKQVVATVQHYMPDIIGFQEAADPKTANNNFPWDDYLQSNLYSLGYSCRRLTDESVKPSTLTIGAGLMIFWKNDRFTFTNTSGNHGSAQYTGLSYTGANGKTVKDTSRYYHYVKLKDTKYNTYLYMFNTHLSINVRSTIPEDEYVKAGQTFRSMEARQLSAKMKELAVNTPCFATGDYNCNYNASVDTKGAYNEQLYAMSRNTPFDSSARVAFKNSPSDYGNMIDHCFLNTNFNSVTERRVIYMENESVRPSDHHAVMSYMNYCAAADFANGTFNAAAKTLTASTASNSFSFGITPKNANITYKIFNETGSQVSEPVTLTKKTNRFSIKFYDSAAVSTTSASVVLNTVDATVTYTGGTDSAPKTVTATNSQACYFSGGAYHVLLSEGKNSTSFGSTLSVYTNASASGTASSSVTGITNGVTTRYAKINSLIYPVYIYKTTGTAESGKYYVDSYLSALSDGQTGAYADKDRVLAVTVGQNGFASINAAASKASSGSTVLVAPGTYTETVSCANKNLTFLGNNHDISPIDRSQNAWSLSTGRAAETILSGQFVVTQSKNTKTVIHGFVFTGTTAQGPIMFTTSVASYKADMDIAHNIFSAITTNTVNGSQIFLNTRTQKTGKIYDNYFGTSPYGVCNSNRIFTMRNLNGLLFDNNFFIGISGTMYNSSEISAGDSSHGYNNVTFSYNRFEDCGSLYNYITTIYDGTSANIQYLYNDFIRCGHSTSQAVIAIYCNEYQNITQDYASCAINIYGNRFVNCFRSIGIYRTSNMSGIAKDMKITVQQNRIMETAQFQEPYAVRLQLYAGSDETTGINCSANWAVNYNYMYAPAVGNTNPSNYISNTITQSDSTSVVCSTFATTPYYTNADLSKLSSGSVTALSGVKVNASSYVYDGTAKALDITTPANSVISYSTDGSSYTTIAPTQTEVGSQTVYYQVEKIGYTNKTGSATLAVTPATITGVTFTGGTYDYDGTAKSPVLNGTKSGDTVTYTYGGSTYTEKPSFTKAGSYEVTVTVKRPNYSDFTKTATITINPVQITGVTVSGFSGVYDAAAHKPVVTGTLSGDTVEYAVDDGAYTTTVPSFTDVCSHHIKVRVSRPNHISFSAETDIVITPATITDVHVSGYEGPADDGAKSVTVTGLRAGDTVTYSTDGKSFSTTKPTYTELGSHRVWVKISRTNFNDIVYIAEVIIAHETVAPLFNLTLHNAALSEPAGTGYSIYWEIDLTPTYAINYATSDIKVLDYGIHYADDVNTLYEYMHAKRFGTTPGQLKMKTYSYAASETGLSRVYETYSYRINKVAVGKVRCAVAYIKYEYNGVIYEEFSAVDATSTILGGTITGIGDTQESIDELED